ncbi:MAG: hypothetical protein ACK5AW_23410, partial [Pseudanabaena sp.]
AIVNLQTTQISDRIPFCLVIDSKSDYGKITAIASFFPMLTIDFEITIHHLLRICLATPPDKH